MRELVCGGATALLCVLVLLQMVVTVTVFVLGSTLDPDAMRKLDRRMGVLSVIILVWIGLTYLLVAVMCR